MIVHFVNVKQFPVINGVVKQSTDKITIAEAIQKTSELRVIADVTIASSAGNPTVKNYLIAEAAAGFKLYHMDQYTIVTYDV